jgi:hypothetical protein
MRDRAALPLLASVVIVATSGLVVWDCSPQVGFDRLMQLQLLHPLSEPIERRQVGPQQNGIQGQDQDQADHQHHGYGYQDSSRDRGAESANANVPRMKTRPLIERTRQYSGTVRLLAASHARGSLQRRLPGDLHAS